jgi:hypoxanthine phosphoribosyltransferase
MNDITYSLSEPIITSEEIHSRVQDLATFIISRYPDTSQLVLVGVLKGSFVFLSDLIRLLPSNLEVDFIQASSYGKGMSSSRIVKIVKDLSLSITDKDVILIEDIIDSGNTIQTIKDLLSTKLPKSLILCSLLSKPARRETDVSIEWVGFTIPDLFIVGYGLDVNEKYRNLPYLAEAIPCP